MSIIVQKHIPHSDGWLYQPQNGEQWDNDPARDDLSLRYSEEYQQKYYMFWLQARAAEWAKTVGDDKIRYIDTSFYEETSAWGGTTANNMDSAATIDFDAWINFACFPPKDHDTGTTDPFRTIPIIQMKPLGLIGNLSGQLYPNILPSAITPNDFNSNLDAWTFQPWADNPNSSRFTLTVGNGNLSGENNVSLDTWYRSSSSTSTQNNTRLFQQGMTNRGLQLYCVQGTEPGNEFFFFNTNSYYNSYRASWYYIGRTHDLASWIYDSPQMGGGWFAATNHRVEQTSSMDMAPCFNYLDEKYWIEGSEGRMALPSRSRCRVNWESRNSFHSGNHFSFYSSETGPWYKNMYIYNHALDPIFHTGDNMLMSGMSWSTGGTANTQSTFPVPGFTQIKTDGKLYLNVAEKAFIRIK